MIKVYNRKTKKIEEIENFGSKYLNIMYKSKILTYIFTSKLVSYMYGIYNNSFLSNKKINKFIKENNIDMSLYEDRKYNSFNDFFIRKKRTVNYEKESNVFISPCDAKLLVYKISEENKIKVKDINYTLDELFDKENLEKYKNGYLFVYRLSLDDYHRYHHIDNGSVIKNKRVKGRFHTVSKYSSKYKIYKENEREYSILDTDNFGEIIYMEVGALLVGKIKNHPIKEFKRGDEKGYFMPGASTIIIAINNIKVDSDILEYNNKNIEVKVLLGEKVGEKLC